MFNLSTKILTTKDNPVDGSIYFDMMISKLYCYTNNNWIEVVYDDIEVVYDDINIKRKDKIISIKSRV